MSAKFPDNNWICSLGLAYGDLSLSEAAQGSRGLRALRQTSSKC